MKLKKKQTMWNLQNIFKWKKQVEKIFSWWQIFAYKIWKTNVYFISSGNRFINNLNLYPFPLGCFQYFWTCTCIIFWLQREKVPRKKNKVVEICKFWSQTSLSNQYQGNTQVIKKENSVFFLKLPLFLFAQKAFI